MGGAMLHRGGCSFLVGRPPCETRLPDTNADGAGDLPLFPAIQRHAVGDMAGNFRRRAGCRCHPAHAPFQCGEDRRDAPFTTPHTPKAARAFGEGDYGACEQVKWRLTSVVAHSTIPPQSQAKNKRSWKKSQNQRSPRLRKWRNLRASAARRVCPRLSAGYG